MFIPLVPKAAGITNVKIAEAAIVRIVNTWRGVFIGDGLVAGGALS
jgi:hypothetical protein